MKMMQQDGEFSPIALVLETKQDALLFAEIVEQYRSTGASAGAHDMSVDISNWLTLEARL